MEIFSDYQKGYLEGYEGLRIVAAHCNDTTAYERGRIAGQTQRIADDNS